MKRHLYLIIFALPFYLLAQSNEDCLTCHGDKSIKTPGRPELYINNDSFSLSVHGKAGISCIDCHSDLKSVQDFPHCEK